MTIVSFLYKLLGDRKIPHSAWDVGRRDSQWGRHNRGNHRVFKLTKDTDLFIKLTYSSSWQKTQTSHPADKRYRLFTQLKYKASRSNEAEDIASLLAQNFLVYLLWIEKMLRILKQSCIRFFKKILLLCYLLLIFNVKEFVVQIEFIVQITSF